MSNYPTEFKIVGPEAFKNNDGKPPGRFPACNSCRKARRKVRMLRRGGGTVPDNTIQCVRPQTKPLIPCQWCNQHSLTCVTVSVRLKPENSNLSSLLGHEGLVGETKRFADGARRVRSTEICELRAVSGVVRVYSAV